MYHAPHSKRNDRGLVTVEFIMIVPLFMMFLIGLITAGVYFFNLSDVRGQAYNAARSVALTGGLGDYSANATIIASCTGTNKNAVVTVDRGVASLDFSLFTYSAPPLQATGRYPCTPS